MKLKLIVPVDYNELAVHLNTYYCHEDKDNPLPTAKFEFHRGVIDRHVDDLMDADAFAEDTVLTDILLRNHTYGIVADILVTRSPGHVVNSGEHCLVLPLVLLEIDY